MIPFFETQVEILQAIVSIRNPILDPIFIFLNYFDSEYFVMALIPFVWLAISPRWGLRIALLLIINSSINHYAKLFFDLPRPIADFPDIAMFPFRDPGFPSGGAQGATLLGGLLIYAWKNPWSWPIGIFYAALLSFSRLYLGVHYPMDIVGGIIIGLLILIAFIYLLKPIESLNKNLALFIAISLCLIYGLGLHSSYSLRMAGAFLGFCLGAYATSNHRKVGIIGAIFTIFVVLLTYVLTQDLPHPLQSFSIALYISFAAIPVCKLLKIPQS